MMTFREQMLEAIRSKCKVVINYRDEGYRIVCPHAMYVSSSGKTRINSYQISGHSTSSRKKPYWRHFDVAKITDLKILDESFDQAPGYKPFSRRYGEVIERV
jgi:predicted DNA-binding transcriptional regulator YafY